MVSKQTALVILQSRKKTRSTYLSTKCFLLHTNGSTGSTLNKKRQNCFDVKETRCFSFITETPLFVKISVVRTYTKI